MAAGATVTGKDEGALSGRSREEGGSNGDAGRAKERLSGRATERLSTTMMRTARN